MELDNKGEKQSGDTGIELKKENPGERPNVPKPIHENVPEAKISPNGMMKFTPDVDERVMWVDPLAHDPRVTKGSVLLRDVISDYVTKWNILFDVESGYSVGKLKAGSYSMTPDERDAYTYVKETSSEKAVKKELAKERNLCGEYFIIPPNSLVYIKLKQKLRLPFYFIGRHNLKIRYVYKGLLLGTGPQVDPGFEGHLYIPLHNFTTDPAKIYITGPESSFVSIDFVRTTHFLETIPDDIRTISKLREYLAEKNLDYLIEKKKGERKELEDYLEGDAPRSQLRQFENDYQAFEGSVSAKLRRFERWLKIGQWAVGISVAALILTTIGLVVATLNFYRGYVADIRSDSNELKSLVANINASGFERRISFLESNSTLSANSPHVQMPALASPPSQISDKFGDLESRIGKLELRIAAFQIGSTNTSISGATNKQSR